MAASYPTSAKTFTTKSNGGTIDASHINDLQEEVTAIENDLITGLPVGRGGTGLTSVTANRIPYGNGTSAFQTSASLTFDGTTFTAPATAITALLNLSGASAGQVQFPASQNASSNANTLDDYEEGNWTPVIGGSGGTSGQTYAVQIGRYIKIGKLVVCWFNTQFSAKGTITTNVQIQGLPFTALNLTNFFGFAHLEWYSVVSSFVYLSAEVQPNTTVATVFGATAAATSLSNLATADLDDNSQIVGLVAYLADA